MGRQSRAQQVRTRAHADVEIIGRQQQDHTLPGLQSFSQVSEIDQASPHRSRSTQGALSQARPRLTLSSGLKRCRSPLGQTQIWPNRKIRVTNSGSHTNRIREPASNKTCSLPRITASSTHPHHITLSSTLPNRNRPYGQAQGSDPIRLTHSHTERGGRHG